MFQQCDETRSNPVREKGLELKDLQEDKDLLKELTPDCESEQKNFEVMMASGGDYSPNSHTFFKQPF